MEYFQGIGLAVAAGALAGALGRRDAVGLGLGVVAAIVGAVLYGLSLSAEDHPAWPGWILGALIALGAFEVVSDVAQGARERAGEGAFTGAIIALVALAIAGLSLLLQPVGLVALLGVLYLSAARRRRASRKYEGLRSLR
jgi:chromate transport protein ChrA